MQRPHEKINHGLVLGGPQGIGKDTVLEPVKRAVGPWNFLEASPQQMLGRFNGFLKCVVLRISEAKDMGEFDRFKFYDHMKTYLAAPPDVLRVDEKHLREHNVFNVCGVVHDNQPQDRRHLSADGRPPPLRRLERQQKRGLRRRLLEQPLDAGTSAKASAMSPPISPNSTFRASTRKPRRRRPTPSGRSSTPTRAPEDAELADVLDTIGNPDAINHPENRGGCPGRRTGRVGSGTGKTGG